MATNSNRLNVSELDFDTIKSNLREFFKTQDVFKDYNYDGTAMNTLLDAMAYITHYNAVNANMAMNEVFLDSAQLRESVVSHAKLLGYVPRSAYAPVAYVDIEVNNPTGVLNDDGSYSPITMTRGTQFTTLIDGQTYTFTNEETLTTTRTNGTYIFENVKLQQGEFRNTTYIYDSQSTEKYIIPDENSVTSTLTVTVQTSESSSEEINYARAETIVGLDDTSRVYFLQEGHNGQYEVYFGDGVVGAALEDGNIIKLSYLVTDTDAANGASVFTLADTIEGNSDVSITTVSKAIGGSGKEDIPSIKFNAPLGFVSQNRAVTPDDYKSIIQNNYANIDAISVWGGEDNDPPDYGKVYISIKPKDAEVVPDADKSQIINQYLKPKNVVSITPVLVDPDYTYIYLEVFFKYNPNVTNLQVDAIENIVRSAIASYNNSELKRFDGVFRHSNLQSTVDNAEVSIVNSTVRVKMKKRFVPSLASETRYEINFSAPIYTSSSNEQVLRSTEFSYRGATCQLSDYIDNSGNRKVQIIRVSGSTVATVERDVGDIDEASGRVVLNAFAPESISGDYIELTVSPDSNDLAPKRNELLTILVNDIAISGEVDTMITGGSAAGIDYTTTPRH
jgi:hypothetical protein